MTTEEYLRTRVADNDLAEPFLKCLEHQRKLELENQGLQKIVDALKGVPLCAKCHGDGFWLYHNSDGSGADRYDCVCKPLRAALDAYKDRQVKKRVEPCPMNCAERWPDWGHAVECPTRKCAKHGLTVCDECAKKLRG